MEQTSRAARQFLISFSGIDGAGKSTQIALLQAALSRAGLRQETITFWDNVVAFKNLREGMGHKVFKGDSGVGSPDKPIRRRDKNVRSPLLTIVRMAFYLFDTLSLRRVMHELHRKGPRAGAEVVVFDRFIYDELANLSISGTFARFYASVILRLVSKPDLAFILDADPDAAFARKPEYPLDFLRTNRNAYLGLGKFAGMTVIGPAPIEEAHAEILDHILRNQDAPRLGAEATEHPVGRKQFVA